MAGGTSLGSFIYFPHDSGTDFGQNSLLLGLNPFKDKTIKLMCVAVQKHAFMTGKTEESDQAGKCPQGKVLIYGKCNPW